MTGMASKRANIFSTDSTCDCRRAMIQVIDSKGNKLLWQGIAVGTVQEGTEDKEARVNKVIGQIYDKYPIPKKEKGSE